MQLTKCYQDVKCSQWLISLCMYYYWWAWIVGCVCVCVGERRGLVQCDTWTGSRSSEECRTDRYHSSAVQTGGWVQLKRDIFSCFSKLKDLKFPVRATNKHTYTQTHWETDWGLQTSSILCLLGVTEKAVTLETRLCPLIGSANGMPSCAQRIDKLAHMHIGACLLVPDWYQHCIIKSRAALWRCCCSRVQSIVHLSTGEESYFSF